MNQSDSIYNSPESTPNSYLHAVDAAVATMPKPLEIPSLRKIIDKRAKFAEAVLPKLQEQIDEAHRVSLELARLSRDAAVVTEYGGIADPAAFNDAIARFGDALRDYRQRHGRLARRMTRPPTIVIVAETGDGKTTALNSMIGLPDALPSGSDSSVTAVPYRVVNDADATEPFGIVEFRTETELLSGPIAAWYADLGLGDPATSFAELPEDLRSKLEKAGILAFTDEPNGDQLTGVGEGTASSNVGETERAAKARRLKTYADRSADYAPYLGQPPRQISLDEFRDFVVQRDPDDNPLVRWLAVKGAELHVAFASGAGEFTFFDTRGRGEDDVVGDRDLSTLIDEEADGVIILSRPLSHRKKDAPQDLRAFDLAGSLPTFAVFNQVPSSNPQADNGKHCADQERELAAHRPPSCFGTAVVDCSSEYDVSERVVYRIASELVASDETMANPEIAALDFAEVLALDEYLRETLAPTAAEIVRLAGQPRRLSSPRGTAAWAVSQFEGVYTGLSADLTARREELSALCAERCADLDSAISVGLEKCRDESFIPSETWIVEKRNGPESYGQFNIVYLQELTRFSGHPASCFAEVERVLERLISNEKRLVAQSLCDRGRLGKRVGGGFAIMADAADAESGEATEVVSAGDYLAALGRCFGRGYPALAEAIGELDQFTHAVRPQLLERIEALASELRADRVVAQLPTPLDLVQAPAIVRQHWFMLYRELVAGIGREIRSAAVTPYRPLHAVFSDFIEQFLYVARDELRDFYLDHADEIWPSDQVLRAGSSDVQERWSAALRQLEDSSRAFAAGCFGR